MSRVLTNESFLEYLRQRLMDPGYHTNAEIRNNGLLLEIHGKTICLTPYLYSSRVEIAVDSGSSGDEESFLSFLEANVNENQIFKKGGRLYSPQREELLPVWERALKRMPSNGGLEKISCKILDRNLGTKKLQNYLYEYMVRPILCYSLAEKKLAI